MRKGLIVLTMLILTACSSAEIASWYGKGFEGSLTASGYVYDSNQLTCASNEHPFGTVLKVTNKKNKKSVVVVVTDRGGFAKYGRKIDLSKSAFLQIASSGHGLLDVEIEVLNKKHTFKYKHGKPHFTSEDYKRYTEGI